MSLVRHSADFYRFFLFQNLKKVVFGFNFAMLHRNDFKWVEGEKREPLISSNVKTQVINVKIFLFLFSSTYF